MKTLSGTFKLIVLTAVGISAVFALRAFAAKPASLASAPYVLNWKTARQLKDPDLNHFKKLLDDNEAIYCITFRKTANDPGTKLDNGGCTTQSATSVDEARREMVLVCTGAHVTQSAGFSSTTQLSAVSTALGP
jgi:hypothetical protein